jgi:hypothetical protein
MGVTLPGAAGEVKESYEISNSLRFNDDGASDGSKLSRSVSGNLSKAHTFSLWVKRSNLKASGRQILAAMGDGSGDISWLEFNNDRLAMIFDGAGNYFPKTDAVFRDVSAWYHIVAKVDTTQSSASERLKLYVNGTQFTDTSGTNPPQNHQAVMDACVIGFNGGDEFDGYMAEFHFLDGVAYDPTYFGEFNDNNVWIPKKYTGGNYGTNGFYLEFQQTGTSANSSGIGADTSGEDHHFTPESLAATDVTEDTPTNNFATLNPLINSSVTFSEGNTKATVGGTVPRVAASTFSVTSGKWYCEVKITATAAGATLFGVEADDFPQNATVYSNGDGVTYNTNGTATTDGSNASYGATYAADDIMGIALNLDDNEITFYKNGASQGAISKTFSGGYVFIGSHGSSSNSSGYNFNFGNPSFSISSGNNDGKYGNFEYAPPSGFYALCTKRLAEFG